MRHNENISHHIDDYYTKQNAIREKHKADLKKELERITSIAENAEIPLSLDDAEKLKASEGALQLRIASVREQIAYLSKNCDTNNLGYANLDDQCDAFSSKATWETLQEDLSKKGNTQKSVCGLNETKIELEKTHKTAKKLHDVRQSFIDQKNELQKRLEDKTKDVAKKNETIDSCEKNNETCLATQATLQTQGLDLDAEIKKLQESLIVLHNTYKKELAEKGTIKIKLASSSGAGGMRDHATAPSYIEVNGTRLEFKKSDKKSNEGYSLPRGIYFACVDSKTGQVEPCGCYDTNGFYYTAAALAETIETKRANKDLILILISVDESVELRGWDIEAEKKDARSALLKSLENIGSIQWGGLQYRNPWYFISGPGVTGDDPQEKHKPFSDERKGEVLPATFESNIPGIEITAQYTKKESELKNELLKLQSTVAIKTKLLEIENDIQKNNETIQNAQSAIETAQTESAALQEQIEITERNVELYASQYSASEEKIKALQKKISVESGKTQEHLETDVAKCEFSIEQIDVLQNMLEKCKKRLYSAQSNSTHPEKKSEYAAKALALESRIADLKKLFEQQRIAFEIKLSVQGIIKINLSSCSRPQGLYNPKTAPAFIEISNKNGALQRAEFPADNGRHRGIFYVRIDSRTGEIVSECYDTFGSYKRSEALANVINDYSDNEHLIHALVSVDESSDIGTCSEKENEPEAVENAKKQLIAALAKLGINEWGKIGFRDRWVFIQGPGIEKKETTALYDASENNDALLTENNPPLTYGCESSVPRQYIIAAYEKQKSELESAYAKLQSEFDIIETSILEFVRLPELQKTLLFLQTELKVVQTKLVSCASSENVSDNQSMFTAQAKYKKMQKALAAELAALQSEEQESELKKIQLFEMDFLAGGIAIRACPSDNATQAEQFVWLLLQSLSKEIHTSTFSQRINAILQNIDCRNHARLSADDLRAILAETNHELVSESFPLLTVMLYRDKAANGNDDSMLLGDPTTQSRQVTIYHRFNHYYLAAPVVEKPVMYASKLWQRIMFEGGLLKSLSLHQIKCVSGQDIHVCLDDELLQAQKIGLEESKKDKCFLDFYNRLLKNNSDNPEIQSARKIIARMCDFNDEISRDDFEKYFFNFKEKFLIDYRSIIQAEFISRIAKTERSTESDAIQKLKIKINMQESEIQQTKLALEDQDKKLISDAAAIEKAIQQSQTLTDSFDAQIQEISSNIVELQDKCVKTAETLHAMQQDADLKDEDVASLQQQLDVDQAAQQLLQTQQKDLQKKRDAISEKLLALDKQKLDITCEINKTTVEKETAKFAHESAKKRHSRISVLLAFIDDIQKIMMGSDSIFKDKRTAIREKITALENSGKKSFADLCDYFIQQPEFSHLKLSEIKDIAGDADIYFDDCLAAMKEIIKGPTIKFERDANTQLMSMLIKGYNISWNECYAELVKYIKAQLSQYGLSLNENNQVIIIDAQMIPALTGFKDTDKLRDLIARKIRTESYPDVYQLCDDEPTWSAENNPAEIKKYIESAAFSFEDIVAAFVEGIEICAGNQLHVESDITLCGLDITLFSERKIFLKPNCKINTSGKDALQFKEKKARDGESQRASEKIPEGRFGDDGLCGYEGQTAGDIFLSAKEDIINIENLVCQANGGKGADGQQGGTGDRGRQGKDSDDATPGDLDGYHRFWDYEKNLEMTNFALALTPGLDKAGNQIENEISGPGGEGGKKGWSGEGGYAGRVYIDIAGANAAGKPAGKEIGKRNDGKNAAYALGGLPGEAGFYGKSRFIFREWRQKKIKMPLPFGKSFVIKPPGIGEWWDREKIPAAYYDIEKFKSRYQDEYEHDRDGKNYSHQYTIRSAIDSWDTVDKEQYRSKNPLSCSDKDYSTIPNTQSQKQKRKHTAKKREEKLHTQQNRQALQQKADHAATLAAVKKSKKRQESELAHLTETMASLENTMSTCDQHIAAQQGQLHDVTSAHQKQLSEKNKIEQALSAVAQQLADITVKVNQASLAAAQAYSKQSTAQSKMHEAELTHQCAKIDLTMQEEFSALLTQTHAHLEKQVHARKTAAQQIYADSDTENHALLSQLDTQIEQLYAMREALQLLLNAEQAQIRKIKTLEEALIVTTQMSVDETTTQEKHEVKIDVEAQPVVQSSASHTMSMTMPEHTQAAEIIETSLAILILHAKTLEQQPAQMQLFVKHNLAWLKQIKHKEISVNHMSQYWSMLCDVATRLDNTDDLKVCVMEAHNQFLEIIVTCFSDELDKNALSLRRNRYQQLFSSDDQLHPINMPDALRFRKNSFQYIANLSDDKWSDTARISLLLEMPVMYDYPKNEAEKLNLFAKETCQLLPACEAARTDLDGLYFEICHYLVVQRNTRKDRAQDKQHNPSTDAVYFERIQAVLDKMNVDFKDCSFLSTHIIARIYNLILDEYQSLFPNFVVNILKPLANGDPQVFAKTFVHLYQESQALCDTAPELMQKMLLSIQLTAAQCTEIVREINKKELTQTDNIFQHIVIDTINIFKLDTDDLTITEGLQFINDIAELNKIPAAFYIEQLRLKTLESFIQKHAKSCESDPVFQRVVSMLNNVGSMQIDKQLQHLKSLHILIAESEKFNTPPNVLSDKLPVYCDRLLEDMRVNLLRELGDNSNHSDVSACYEAIFSKLVVMPESGKSKLTAQLQQFLFLVEQGDLCKIDLNKLERWVNTSKDRLFACEDNDSATLWHHLLHCVDNLLDQHLMTTMHARIEERSKILSKEQIKQIDLDEHLKIFHQFIPCEAKELISLPVQKPWQYRRLKMQ